jgi:hypothetical protein
MLLQKSPLIKSDDFGDTYSFIHPIDQRPYVNISTRELSAIENYLNYWSGESDTASFLKTKNISIDYNKQVFNTRDFYNRNRIMYQQMLSVGNPDLNKVRLFNTNTSFYDGGSFSPIYPQNRKYRFLHEFNGDINSNFGCSVSLYPYNLYAFSSPNIAKKAEICIGASNDSNRGAVYVYDYSGYRNPIYYRDLPNIDNITIKHKFTGNLNSFFGSSMIMTSGHLLIGAPKDNLNAGSIYYYKRTGDNWVFQQKIDSPVFNGQFGTSLAINNEVFALGYGNIWGKLFPIENKYILAVGGTGNPITGCLVYTLDINTDTWILKSILTGNFNSKLGYSLSMDRDGHIITVGAPHDSTNGTNAGAVYVYTGNSNIGWNFNYKLTGKMNSLFGSSVHTYGYNFLSGRHFLIDSQFSSYRYISSCKTKSLANIIVGAPGYNQNSGAFFSYNTPFYKPYEWSLFDILENKESGSSIGHKIIGYPVPIDALHGTDPGIIFPKSFNNKGLLLFSNNGHNNTIESM